MSGSRHRPSRLPLAAYLIALVLLGSPAESASQVDPAREDLLFAEIPSVFVASKFEQLSTEAPASVSVITGETIQRHGWRTLAEILGSVRGFYISGDRMYEYLGVRGFSRPGDYNTRVLLLVDGHRVNETLFESILLGQGGIVDVSMIDRIEVVRGPGSSIYGTSAFFGVVNVVTRSGRDLEGVRVRGEVGSLGARGGSLAVGKRSGGVEYLVGGRLFRREGEDLYFAEYDSPDTNDGLAANRDGERTAHAFAKLGLRDFTVEGIFSNREKDVPTAPYGTDFAAASPTRTLDRFLVGRALLDRTFRGGGRLTASGSLNHYLYEGFYPIEGVANYDKGEGTWFMAEASYGRTLGDAHHLVVGAEYRASPRMVQRNWDTDPYRVYLDHRADGSNAGIFLQDEIRYRSWLVSAGLRLDYASTFGSTLNPRLAAVFTPNRSTAVKVLYGSAFRAPNAYELYYNDTYYQKGNPELDPESISTLELVAERTLAQRFRLTGSLFRYQIDDLISEAIDPQDDFLFFSNRDRVHAHGVEMEAEADLGRLTGSLSWVVQDVRDEVTDEVLSNSPRHLGKARALLSLVPDRLYGGLDLRAMSERRLENRETLDGHLEASLALTARGVYPGFDLGVVVSNLFDSRFADPPSSDFALHAIPRERRTLRIWADLRF